ncbi:RNA-directed DNA polymerase, eukaryota [Artemisia annua]|uniref:RNA-directed DNA polymerase, eukaryota n=1 Tax=Artemisia annua TaxID=35608 RepID=A0A2U1QGJ6_ARTAN|nr:RNA-directed DNA polymerase, eukaryota [Artemisia annua]
MKDIDDFTKGCEDGTYSVWNELESDESPMVMEAVCGLAEAFSAETIAKSTTTKPTHESPIVQVDSVNILKASKELDAKNVSLDALVKKRIGDGTDTMFWKDMWIGECPLKEKFPRIFRLDAEPNAKVKDRILLSLDSVWLRRHLRGGAEFEQWNHLLTLLGSCTLSPQKDRWVSSGDGTGVFTVASGRNIIDMGTLVIDNTPTRWSKDVLIKINVFIWKLLLDKLLTRDNLEEKGLDVPSSLCGICDDVTECSSHVFLSCQVAMEIWRQIGRWWDLDIPHLSSMKDLLGWVDNLKISKIQRMGLYNVVITAAWSIWRFRNETVFGVNKPKKALIFDFIVSQDFFWMSNRNKKLRCNWIGTRHIFLDLDHSVFQSEFEQVTEPVEVTAMVQFVIFFTGMHIIVESTSSSTSIACLFAEFRDSLSDRSTPVQLRVAVSGFVLELKLY